MKTTALILSILIGITTPTLAAPVVGQVVIYKTSSTRSSPALVSKIVSGDTVNLVAVIDASDDWPVINVPSTNPAWLYTSIAKGTGVGEWQEATIPTVLIDEMESQAEGVVATELGGGGAITSAIETATAGQLASPTGWSSPARTLNSNFKPSATRTTLTTYSGTWSGTLTATGSVAGVIQLLSDTAGTPTTECDDQQPAFSATLLIGVALTQVSPWKVTCMVPADFNVRLATSGTGSFAITSITESPL